MRPFACFIMLLLLMPHLTFAADDLSSMKRTPDSTKAGSIGSMQRAKPKSDPMLDTSAPAPKSALSTDNMKSSDPMLSTTQKSPASALTTSGTGNASGSGIDPRLCQTVTKYQPAPDVAYQPGTGANGQKVAPADLPGQNQMQLPQKFEIPLTVNIAKALNLNTSQYPYSELGSGTETWLGSFTVDGDQVSFNGQPLTDDQQKNLSVLCLGQK